MSKGAAKSEKRSADRAAAKTPAESIKETIDSILVAFCLAFVFRAFVVEAFVIPTGSMADTLLGEHRQFICEKCGYRYDFGVGGKGYDPLLRDELIFCPTCNWQAGGAQLRSDLNPDRGGDKILVLKFSYLLSDPDRWDVVVFYNPQKPDENFIKRLIGLPGEAIQILDGDIYVREPGRDDFQIARKPAKVQRALWRPIYLNDYMPAQRAGRPWTVPGWFPATPRNGWLCGTDQPISESGGAPYAGEIVYRPPSSQAARIVFRPAQRGGESGREALSHPIGFYDYYAYNSYRLSREYLNVVRDLKLDFVAFFDQPGGLLRASLDKFDRRFILEVRQDGRVELLMRAAEGDDGDVSIDRAPRAESVGRWQLEPFEPGRGVSFSLVNVDYRVSVWIDGVERIATTDEQYGPKTEWLRQTGGRSEHVPSVWMEAEGAWPQAGQPAVRLRHVSLFRDIYYTSRTGSNPVNRGAPGATESDEVRLADYAGRDDDDEFFVMGDNSPASSDGRVWDVAGWQLADRVHPYQMGRVPRDHLIGKAFFVYWPAGLEAFNTGLTIVPNVGRMRLIH